MEIAYTAHHGQTDKCGVPYVFHPFHVAEQMTTEYTVCAALLHDVIEDTYITADDIGKIFPQEIVNAVKALTHDKGTPYEEYISGIMSDPIAKAVKLADLEHNSDNSRMSLTDEPEEKKLARLKKYTDAAEKLRKG